MNNKNDIMNLIPIPPVGTKQLTKNQRRKERSKKRVRGWKNYSHQVCHLPHISDQ